MSDYTMWIKSQAVELGADLVGVADTKPLALLKSYPPNLLSKFHRAISIAVSLPSEAFEQITDRPTPSYSLAYRAANRLLDQLALGLVRILRQDGFSSMAIPATQIIDQQNCYGAVSHKAVGNLAGLGWQGKSLLLVSPQYGPRIRLATVLTVAQLDIDTPIANRCGTCTQCQDACPARAIKGSSTGSHYETREEAFNLQLCTEKLNEFSTLPDVEPDICGICIKVCPAGL